MSLENAPDEVKLAVDLIMLLENHGIPTETVLKALEIVKRDFEGKLPSPALSLKGRRPERGGTSRRGRIVTLNVTFHFSVLVALFIAQMHFQLVKGDIDVVLAAHTFDGAVQFIHRVAAIAQFTHVQTQLMI